MTNVFVRSGIVGAESQRLARLNNEEQRRKKRFAKQEEAIDFIQSNAPQLQQRLGQLAQLQEQTRLAGLRNANADAAALTAQQQQAQAPVGPGPQAPPPPAARSGPVQLGATGAQLVPLSPGNLPPPTALPGTAPNGGINYAPGAEPAVFRGVGLPLPEDPAPGVPVTGVESSPEAREMRRNGIDPGGVNFGGGAMLDPGPGGLAGLGLYTADGRLRTLRLPPPPAAPVIDDPSPARVMATEAAEAAAKAIQEAHRGQALNSARAFSTVGYWIDRAGQFMFGSAANSEAETRALDEEYRKEAAAITDALVGDASGEPELDAALAGGAAAGALAPELTAPGLPPPRARPEGLGATGRARTGGTRTATPKNVNTATPAQIAKTKPGNMLTALRSMNVREPAAVRNAVRAAQVLSEVGQLQLGILANTVTFENVGQVGPAMAAIFGDVAQRKVELEQGLLGAYTDAAIRAGDPVGSTRFLSDALGYDVQVVPAGNGFQLMVNGQVEGTYGSKGKLMQRLKTMADPAFGGQVSAMQQKMALEDLKFQRQMQLKQMEIQGRIRAAGISASGGGRPKSSSVTEVETGIPGVIRVQARDPVTNATRGDTLVVNPGARWPNGEPIPIGTYDIATFEAMMREQQ